MGTRCNGEHKRANAQQEKEKKATHRRYHETNVTLPAESSSTAPRASAWPSTKLSRSARLPVERSRPPPVPSPFPGPIRSDRTSPRRAKVLARSWAPAPATVPREQTRHGCGRFFRLDRAKRALRRSTRRAFPVRRATRAQGDGLFHLPKQSAHPRIFPRKIAAARKDLWIKS